MVTRVFPRSLGAGYMYLLRVLSHSVGREGWPCLPFGICRADVSIKCWFYWVTTILGSLYWELCGILRSRYLLQDCLFWHRIAGPKVEELITTWKNYASECHQRVVQCKVRYIHKLNCEQYLLILKDRENWERDCPLFVQRIISLEGLSRVAHDHDWVLITCRQRLTNRLSYWKMAGLWQVYLSWPYQDRRHIQPSQCYNLW